MRFRLGLIILVVTLNLTSTPVTADVTRTCSAQVTAHVNGKSEVVAAINGVGHCRNKYHANECRTLARKANEACLSALWPTHMANQPPIECRAFPGGGRPYAELTYQGIYMIANSQRYLNRLAHVACCRLAPGKDFATLTVSGQKWGKNHCAGQRVSKDHYQDDFVPVHGPVNFDCRKRRQEGICG